MDVGLNMETINELRIPLKLLSVGNFVSFRCKVKSVRLDVLCRGLF